MFKSCLTSSSLSSCSFSGIKVPLSGLKTLKVPAGGAQTGGSQQIYSVMASTHGTSDFCLLTSNKHKSGNNVFGPAFSGLLNVCENFGGGGASQTPQVIPAVPAPSIPPGLKQRFHPFGSKAPTLAESEVDGASFGPSSPTLKRVVEEDEDEEEGRKKKKKKKKDKEARKEQVEYVQEIKSEPESDAQEEEMMETEVVEEKRKKKKKKKDRERDEEVECVDGVTVKTEPTDTSYEGGAEGSGKKKKKKKDRERNEEEEECVVSGVTVKVEDVTVKTEQIDTSYENGAEVSGKKKKKKKKNRSEDD